VLSQTRPISISHTRAAPTTAPVSSSAAATRSHRSPDASPSLSPDQAYHQHHIIVRKLPSYSPTALLPSGHRNAIAAPRSPPPAPVRRQLAASAPLFPNTGHPRDRCELLNLFPHFPLAAGEPPHWNSIATGRFHYVARPRIQLQRFKSFQGPFCGKSEPPYLKSAKFENS
jgi:hypothetical protein